MIKVTNAGTDLLSLITTQNGASVVVSYNDDLNGVYTGSRTPTNITSATTTTIVGTPAASTIRDIDYLSIKNTYAGSQTITLQYSANATLFPMAVVTLAENETFEYTHAGGFKTIDATGAAKVGTSGWVIAAGKIGTLLKTMSFTAADDTGVYTFPTGTKTLLAADGTGSSLTAVNAITLLTKTWAAPDAIGSGTPAAGSFTTLSASNIAALTTTVESWIGPSSITGVYFKSGYVGVATTDPGAQFQVGTWVASFGQGLRIANLARTGAGGTPERRGGSTKVSFNSSTGQGVTFNGSIAHKASDAESGATDFARLMFSASSDMDLDPLGFPSTAQLVIQDNGNIAITAAAKLYWDGVAGTGDTYTCESSANVLDTYVGGVNVLKLSATLATVSQVLSVTDATDAASATVASLKTAGGGAFVKGIWVGTTSRLAGAVTMGGTAPLGYARHRISTTFTSDGASSVAIGTLFDGSVTGAPGDTSILAGVDLGLGGLITQTASESIGIVAGLYLNEPQVVNNLTGGGVITKAATLYIVAAPTEGVTNAALWVNAGDVIAGGNTRLGGLTTPTVACDVTGAILASTTITATGGFGCNTKAAQTAYASGGALAAYGAGANGFDSGANASALHAMVVSIRAALVANGIMS